MKKKSLGLIVLLVLATVLGACSNYQFKPTTSYEIQDFTHTDHRGDTVTLDDLKGKPWLAMFIFTNCTTICSPMTYNMTEIQQQLVERGIEDYNIVAFSVDPEYDTPKVLTEYLSRYTVPDESKWHLMTGYDQTYMEQFAAKSFKSLVKAIEGDDQVMHANTFYLVDEQGVAVKNYTGYSQTDGGVPFDTIAIDMESLIADRLEK